MILKMPFELSPLPYAFDALEPYIDAKTMEIHHDKHHQTYVNNLNAALAKVTRADIAELSIEELLAKISDYPPAVRNNAGGHYNHSLFWNLIKPGGSGVPMDKLGDPIESTFGSFDAFKMTFSTAAADRFGSGWVWLIKTESAGLEISSTPNQDNPLMDIAQAKGYPILGLDVWEHAYYLKYQNKRVDYINAWWNVINWEVASFRFEQSGASSKKKTAAAKREKVKG
jgi:Fe-Mn family superoxide dismutase